MVEDRNPEAARLITLYRQKREEPPPARAQTMSALTKIGVVAADLPIRITDTLDFAGRCAAALPKTFASPRSVDWLSLPRLVQQIGADALPVTSAANLLVGVIIGFLGVSQLGRFGAVAYVPELVVVAHFRELGPLVTAIVVAGRSGAGLASEIATMKVSEEIDALRSMGFDPVRWLVVPRCVALVLVVPLLTWVGDALALLGGLMATVATTDLTPRAYVLATMDAITVNHFAGGPYQEPVPGARDRTDRLRSGTGDARWCRRCRRQDDDRRGPRDFRSDCHQRSVHAPVRGDGHLIMSHSRPHIIVEDLRIGWGTRVLMEHVTFDIERGTTFVILGGSGSGKSTLLRYLIGLEQPMAGRIDIDGVGEPHRYEGVPPFGVLFQSGALFSSMTLADNLALPLTRWTPIRGATVRDLVQAKLDLVGLGAFADHLPARSRAA
jgi:ABC transport permease subunit